MSSGNNLRGMLAALLDTEVARSCLNKLDDGQGTDTDEGRVWLKARAMVAGTPSEQPVGAPSEQHECRVISYVPGMGEVTFYVRGGVPEFMDVGNTIIVSAPQPKRAAAEVPANGRTTPYPNCQFRVCDLPGQCLGEGACHHPAVPAALAQQGNTITIQEAWEAAGGNPGIKATKQELIDALKQLDAVCDDVDEDARRWRKAVSVVRGFEVGGLYNNNYADCQFDTRRPANEADGKAFTKYIDVAMAQQAPKEVR